MILSFTVGNFRSFHEEQTLELIASKKLKDSGANQHCTCIPGTNESALRVAAIYGANGAGKSNLVRALNHVRDLILRGTATGHHIPYDPFRLSKASGECGSSFDLQFMEKDKVFRYAFCHDGEKVTDEALSIYEGSKEKTLFKREDHNGVIKVSEGRTWKESGLSDRLKALIVVGARPNQLFLSEIVNLGSEKDQGELCGLVISWFQTKVTIITAGAHFEAMAQALEADEGLAQFVSEYLNKASTGVAQLKVATKSVKHSKIKGLTPEIWQIIEKDFEDDGAIASETGAEILFNKSNKDIVKLRQITALHITDDGEEIVFPVHEESDGTRQLLNLLPALYMLSTSGGVFVIDELERSMHPTLARKFVEFFVKAAKNTNSQLIFTTHESTLLDQELLRRDGVWFTEKNKSGATQLYALSEFGVRNDLKIEKGYLQGRFGAIPFLGGIDRLMELHTK